MSDTDRKTMIEAFRSGPARLRKAVDRLGAGLEDYRPFEDAWTIRENIAHLCDAEVCAYSRHRKAVAEPGARVDMWDEIKWHASLRYATVDFSQGLALYEGLRLATASLLGVIAGDDWSGYSIVHPQRGKETLEQVTAFFVGHDSFHLDLIERNKRLFKEKGGH